MNPSHHNPGPETRPLNILCAEDNTTNQLVIGAILDGLGHKVTFAGNGQEAVDQLSMATFDVVLMDNRMPIVDGFEATRIIRDPGSTVLDHQVPIIALTANVSSGYRDECFSAGMNDFLTKPVREPALRIALARAMNRAQPEIPREIPAPEDIPLADTSPPPGLTEEDLLALFDDAQDSPPVDPAAQLSPEARRKINQQYLADTPKLMNVLRVSYGLRDFVTLGRAGHSLKSSSRYVRAERLSEIGRDVERLAESGEVSMIPSLLNECDREFAQLVERLLAEAA